MIKIVGIFVSFLLGSLLLTSATVASRAGSANGASKSVYVGERVGFNLTVMFKGVADPKEMWVIAPDGVKMTLTNTAMFVISDVQLSDAGNYRFYAKNKERIWEYVVTLDVKSTVPNMVQALFRSLFFQKLRTLDTPFFALVSDDEQYWI